MVVEENVQQAEALPSPHPDVVEENVQEQPEDDDDGVKIEKEVEEEMQQQDVEDLVEVEVPEEDAEQQVVEVNDEDLQQSEVGESSEESELETVQQEAESTDDKIELVEDGYPVNEEEDKVIVPDKEEDLAEEEDKPVSQEKIVVPTKDVHAARKEKKTSLNNTDEREAKTPLNDAEKEIRKEKKASLKAVERDSEREKSPRKSPRKDTERKEKKVSLKAVEKEERDAKSPRKDSRKASIINLELTDAGKETRKEKKASLKDGEKEPLGDISPRRLGEISPRRVGEISPRSEKELKDDRISEQNLQIVGECMGHEEEMLKEQQQQHGSLAAIRVSVLYNQTDGNVLFLEGGKDFVDLLMNFLLLPIGSVMKLLHDNKADLTGLGAVVRLFQSMEKLEPSIMVVDKDVLTMPKSERSEQEHHQIEQPLAPQLQHGYVKENLTFTITDELEIFPTSTIKSIALLNQLQVKNMADLKSMEVSVDTTDVLRLLRASLTRKSVLNYVFQCRLPNQHEHERCDRCSVHCK
ncbi:FK506-binding protein 3-like isoform X2 [Selaginella moellendorffii]|uniref:FK506-binding protein 3-like isoform X2 n=1 Tax=Selaginella moellendorffii TaxID=88036 RepID=UPI000D1CAB83|nr:FK506-binding protein 3-like isoform X2 [Selaginella moellendorffii]|eukprot:XP_024520848.1 FK506-binding protein 3-like isoform X2 [Selaginella moellendorffii]